MKWHVFSVGHARGDDFEPMVREYAGRINRKVLLEIRVFPDEAGMDRAIGDGRRRILLTEHGSQPVSSDDFSRRIEALLSRENRDIVFVIGGSHGHSDAFLQKAHDRLSLSNLTLPHRLARLMLVEQLYRALSILAKEPYHH